VLAQAALGHRSRELTAGDVWAVVGQAPVSSTRCQPGAQRRGRRSWPRPGRTCPRRPGRRSHGGWRCRPPSAARPARRPRACRQRRCPGRPSRQAGRRSGSTRRARPWLGWSRCRGRRGQLGQGGHPLGPTAEPVPARELRHPSGRSAHPTLGQVLDQALGADGGAGHRLGQHHLDLVGWGGGRQHRWPAALGSSAASPERWARPAQRSSVVLETPKVGQASVTLVWPARSRTWTRRW
jgi:hypothetical protein